MNLSPCVELKYLHAIAKDAGVLYGTDMSAGIDLVAAIDAPVSIAPGKAILISTGLAVLMNNTHMSAVLLPRSGLGHKKGLVLGNLVGLIDADYTGPVMVSAWNRNLDGEDIVIQPGERFAQMVFVPILKPTFKVVDEFSAITGRGAGGFGSTGST